MHQTIPNLKICMSSRNHYGLNKKMESNETRPREIETQAIDYKHNENFIQFQLKLRSLESMNALTRSVILPQSGVEGHDKFTHTCSIRQLYHRLDKEPYLHWKILRT